MLGDVAFQYLAFVDHSPPQVVRLAVDLHENLVEMPPPVRKRSHPTDSVSADLCREHRAKSVSPEPNRFMTSLDAALMQKVFNVPQR